MNSHFKAVLYSSYILLHEILFILLSETPSKNMTFQSMIMKVGKNRERLFQNTGSKCLAIGVRQRLLHDVISFSNSFKVIHRGQKNKKQWQKAFTNPTICIFKKSNPILQLIFQNSGSFISFAMSLSPNQVKRAQSCTSCIEGDRKMKFITETRFLKC